MVNWLEIGKDAMAAITPLAAGGGLWAYLKQCEKTKTEMPISIASSQASIAAALAEQTGLLLKESAKDRNGLKRRIDRTDTLMLKLAKEVALCNVKHSACEDSVAAMRAQIAELASQNAQGNNTVIVNTGETGHAAD